MAEWRPMSEAKKDGTPYLLKFKLGMGKNYAPPNDIWAHPERFKFPGSFIAVMQNWSDRYDGHQFGYWQFAAPIGHGGWTDKDFEGFQELPQ